MSSGISQQMKTTFCESRTFFLVHPVVGVVVVGGHGDNSGTSFNWHFSVKPITVKYLYRNSSIVVVVDVGVVVVVGVVGDNVWSVMAPAWCYILSNRCF